MKKLIGGLLGKKNGTESQGQGAKLNSPTQFTVISSDELLSNEKRQAIVNKVHSLISLPDKHYEALVTNLFKRFAEYVQLLPATEKHHHSVPGGLLDHSLQVTLYSLLIRRGFMLPIGAPPEILAKKQEIWSYGTLTAALMKNLGLATIHQRVSIFDKDGEFVGRWNPLRGGLGEYGSYDIAFSEGEDGQLGARITPLLAERILPKDGLHWLASDPEIFNQWLALLSNDMAGSGILGQMVDRANKENILKYMNEQGMAPGQPTAAQPPAPTPSMPAAPQTGMSPPPPRPRADSPRPPRPEPGPMPPAPPARPDAGNVPPPPPRPDTGGTLGSAPETSDSLFGQLKGGASELGAATEMTEQSGATDEEVIAAEDIPSDLGEFFFFWLKREIKKDKLPFNKDKGPLQRVQEGILLVCPSVFQKFVDANPELDTMADAVQKRFQKLKYHKKNGTANYYNYASYETGKRVVLRGFLISDTSQLMEDDDLPEVNDTLEQDYI